MFIGHCGINAPRKKKQARRSPAKRSAAGMIYAPWRVQLPSPTPANVDVFFSRLLCNVCRKPNTLD